jgi:hypothetical protein
MRLIEARNAPRQTKMENAGIVTGKYGKTIRCASIVEL